MNDTTTSSGSASNGRLADASRRLQLIEVTLASLAEVGAQGTTLAHIAGKAGVSAGLVAHYFTDKEGLLEAAFRVLLAKHRDQLRWRLTAANEPGDRLKACVEACLSPEGLRASDSRAWLAFWSLVHQSAPLARIQQVYQRRMLSSLRAALRCGGATGRPVGLPAPADRDEAAAAHRVAVRVLGGATSSRLFTEVREKRGLCYSVGASSSLGKDRGLLQVYAGSTHERAPTTLDCIMSELERFERGITPDEFRDAVVGAKSALVMSGESSSARAATIALQLWRMGRPRTLAESAAEYDRLTLSGVNAYVAREMGAAWRARRTLVTVAPAAGAEGQ